MSQRSCTRYAIFDFIQHHLHVYLQAAKFAHHLCYTPAARAEFKRICVELEVDGSHNVRRDVQTRWNLTDDMLEDVEHLWLAM